MRFAIEINHVDLINLTKSIISFISSIMFILSLIKSSTVITINTLSSSLEISINSLGFISECLALLYAIATKS